MELKDWQEGIKAWENVKKTAQINMEQAELYIQAIQQKIKTIEENNEVE